MADQKRKFKTRKVLSGVRSEYRMWKEWAEGDTIVCKLIGTSPNRKNKSKVDWIVESLEVQFEDRAEMKRLKAGTRVTLNAAGQLDKGMAQIEVGGIVQITYTGQVEIKGGDYKGEMAHTMEVIEVEEDDGDEDSGDDEQEDDDNESDDEEDDDSDDL